MIRYRTRLARLCGLAVIGVLAAGTAQASVVYWDGTGSNDSTSWAGLGPNGTTITSPFSATSTGGNAITGSFASATDTGQTAVVGTGWTPVPPTGFASGDTLVWTLDNTTGLGAGPLTLGFGTAVLAGGLYLQADAPGQFNAEVQAFDGATSLGTESLASDAAGDPVFIGAIDSTADISSLVFSMTSCGAVCDINDFAVDTLLSKNPGTVPPPPPVPEPASVWLFGGALAALGLVTFRRRRRL
ncbi:MAG: PEP-CTERM sorting domain-containing protein [Stellaceae bacterium]